jgi:Ankyrin repeats (3 copies)
VDASGRTPLHHACAASSSAIVGALVAAAPLAVAKPDGKGWTPLHECAGKGQRGVEALKSLVHNCPQEILKGALDSQVGAGCGYCGGWGDGCWVVVVVCMCVVCAFAFPHACVWCVFWRVPTLLFVFSDSVAQDVFGRTALDVSCALRDACSAEAVNLLLARGSNPRLRDTNQRVVINEHGNLLGCFLKAPMRDGGSAGRCAHFVFEQFGRTFGTNAVRVLQTPATQCHSHNHL